MSTATEVAENAVRLVGRVSGVPEERVLPSGDRVAVARVVVPRASGGRRTKQRVDVVDCAAWTARARRSVVRWASGDTVAVEGALRRRFYRSGGRTASRVEVEINRCRRLRRGSAG